MRLDLQPGHYIRGFHWTGLGEDGSGDGTGSGPAGDGDGTGAGDGAGSGGPDGGSAGGSAGGGSSDGTAEGFSFSDPSADALGAIGFDAIGSAIAAAPPGMAADLGLASAVAVQGESVGLGFDALGQAIANAPPGMAAALGQAAAASVGQAPATPSWLSQTLSLAWQSLLSKGLTTSLGPFGFVAAPAVNAGLSAIGNAIGAATGGAGVGAGGAGAPAGDGGGVVDAAEPPTAQAPRGPAPTPAPARPVERVIYVSNWTDAGEPMPRYVTTQPAQPAEPDNRAGLWIAALAALSLLS